MTTARDEIQALYTEQTCADACWYAREDICRCSCGGRNHGILRSEDGEQPARSRKVKEVRYQLVAVESRTLNRESCKAVSMRPLFDAEREIIKHGRELKGLEWHVWMSG